MFGLQPYQQDYYNQVFPVAQQIGAATGVNPSIVFAQSALETGWGQSVPNNNYFGIKDFNGGSSYSTGEYINGEYVIMREPFAGYGGLQESAAGYVDLINSGSRYEAFRSGGTVNEQLQALQQSGYATDPNYASKVGSIVNQIGKPGFWETVDDWLFKKDFGPGAAAESLKDDFGVGGFIDEYLSRFAFIFVGLIMIAVGLVLIGVIGKGANIIAGDAIKGIVQNDA